MRRFLRTIRHEGEEVIWTGGFFGAAILLAFLGIVALCAALVVAVSVHLGMVWGFVSAALFVFILAAICLVIAGRDEPEPARKPSSADNFSPFLRIIEDVASDLISGAQNGSNTAGLYERSSHTGKATAGSAATLAAALIAGAVVGYLEQNSGRKK